MISTSFRWTKTVAAAVLILNCLLYAQAFYDGSARRLEITPKDCTSLKFPNAIGTCMFNLKCKEKLGVVIGACVDRFLFGACCHFPQVAATSGVDNNVTVPAQGIPSSTPKLGTDPWPTDIFSPSTTIRYVPLISPFRDPPSEYVVPPPRYPQATDPLQSSNAPIKLGDPTPMPPSRDYTTLLPVPLAIVPHSSDPHNQLHLPASSNFHLQHGGLFLPLEYSTLKSAQDGKVEETTTEEPPRLSTFMYVDGMLSEGSTNPVESSTNPTSFPPNSEQRLTTLEPPALSGSGTETLWSIVHQLVPSNPKQPAAPDVPLNSDELYNVLSASEPVGSIMENRIQVIPPLDHGVWKVTTTSSVSQTVVTPPPPSPPRPNTNRPWASSTYEIHIFKYPEMGVTTPFPGGGLVTWSGILDDRISIPQRTTQTPSTSTTQRSTTTTSPPVTTTPRPRTTPPPVATTGSFLVRTTTKPVAEVTKPPPVTTRKTTTTERATTTSATTTTTTTPPPRRRTTPKEVTTKPTPKPKVTSPPKPPEIQPGILQSDFDSNIDDFVNQVVQNLAGSLDNLDLDEVILHPPSPSSIAKEDAPPTLHPLHVLSDPLFLPYPVVGQVPLIKPSKPPVKKVTPPTTTSRPLDYRRDCGVRSLTKQGRIVGGSPAKFGKWPWQALVREATWLGLFSKNKCGGVLISPKYVLTAAHCQPGFLATLTVVLGDFDISSETEGTGTGKNPNSITKNVRRVIVHRDYNAQTFENDIALLELDTVVEYQPHIVPICLPMDNEVHVGQHAFVTGWGRLKYGGGVPNMLYEVDVPILNNTDCQNMFLKSGHIKAIRESFICAGYANGAKDSCEGDSGGPLAMMRENGQWMLAGTVSHGIKCAYPNLPGVYMRMTYYKPWIKRVTGITNAD